MSSRTGRTAASAGSCDGRLHRDGGKGYRCGFLWVLRDNPSRYFYERVGGKMIAEGQERLWGCTTDQVCYGWPDLAQAIDRAAQARTPRLDDRLGEGGGSSAI